MGTVWLDRPPVNAVNQRMYAEIREPFTQEGRHFCGGNDLGELTTDPATRPSG